MLGWEWVGRKLLEFSVSVLSFSVFPPLWVATHNSKCFEDEAEGIAHSLAAETLNATQAHALPELKGRRTLSSRA